jgi:hypothetical protein
MDTGRNMKAEFLNYGFAIIGSVFSDISGLYKKSQL